VNITSKIKDNFNGRGFCPFVLANPNYSNLTVGECVCFGKDCQLWLGAGCLIINVAKKIIGMAR